MQIDNSNRDPPHTPTETQICSLSKSNLNYSRRVAAWLSSPLVSVVQIICRRLGKLEMISFWLLCWRLLVGTRYFMLSICCIFSPRTAFFYWQHAQGLDEYINRMDFARLGYATWDFIFHDSGNLPAFTIYLHSRCRMVEMSVVCAVWLLELTS